MIQPIQDLIHMRHAVIIAHRGASGCAPENTIAAFEKAAKMKADMIELDIQLTQDRQWVVMHDLSLKRTCGLRQKVESIPLSKIKTLDAGSWFSSVFSGEKVPTLNKLLGWASHKINLNLEIKGKSKIPSECIQSLLETISSHGMERHVLLSSFDWKVLRNVRSYDKRVAIGLLVNREPGFRYKKEAVDLKAVSIHLPKQRMRKGLSEKLHRFKMRVYLYTLNSRHDMKKYLEMGIDGFFTNYPDLPQEKGLIPELKGNM